jgi:Spy/CpxP family protein refolding chaperone
MIQSRWSKVLGILPLVGALAGFAGCNNPPDASEESTEVAPAELGATPGAAAKDRTPEHARGEFHGHARGPAWLLGAALHELDLTDAQKAAIKGEMDALNESVTERGDDHAAERKALADAVRSGKVDEAAFAKPLAREPVDQARLAKALATLHDTLDANQRKQLVDAVLAKMENHGDHEGKRGDHEGKRGDHEGKRGDHEGKRGPDGESDRGMHGPMGHLLQGIDLTDAQREGVRAAFEKMAPSEADRTAMKAQHEAGRKAMSDRLATFANDRFDASAFVAMPAGAAMGGPEAEVGRMVKMLAVVTPILDETQRAELAKRLEEGPAAHPRKGKRGKHAE